MVIVAVSCRCPQLVVVDLVDDVAPVLGLLFTQVLEVVPLPTTEDELIDKRRSEEGGGCTSLRSHADIASSVLLRHLTGKHLGHRSVCLLELLRQSNLEDLAHDSRIHQHIVDLLDEFAFQRWEKLRDRGQLDLVD